MSKRNLPELHAVQSRDGIDFEITPQALQRWNPAIRAAGGEGNSDAGEISIYGYIGESWDGSGITAGRIAGALRNIGKKNVVVNINSPGGSAFEGIAIYNLLRAHDGEVTVRVMGLAASAASIIAMAGDTIEMGRAAFMMIHNTLMLAIGNRNDLRDAADTMEPIDRAMADLYAARSGLDAKAVGKLMDKETWLGGSDAIEQGFADALMEADAVTEDPGSKKDAVKARAQVQVALAKAGFSRSQARDLLKNLGGMSGAVANPVEDMPSAVSVVQAVQSQPSQEPSMDITKLKAEHPALFEAVMQEGITAGGIAERTRIQEVEAQALPGHEALIAALKFDGKTTGPQAAVQVLAAEKATGGRRLAAVTDDAAQLAAVTATPSALGATRNSPAAAADESLPLEDRCKAKWDADAAVRAEFLSLAHYTAYEKANASGLVRIQGGKRAA